MNKPNFYDETKASGEFVPVAVGGHYCTIKQVSETKSKTGKDMIVVLFDFCAPDAQAGYFTDSFRDDIREDKKWPFAGSKYIMVNDYQDASKVSKQFKTFCSCVEKSNPGFTIAWGENWGKQFINKKVGAVYGLEENEYDGKTSMRPAMKWFCNYDAVSTAQVPEPKYLKKDAVSTTTFVNLPADDSELPF